MGFISPTGSGGDNNSAVSAAKKSQPQRQKASVQHNIKASISKIGSKKIGILEDISIDEKRLLQYHRENNRLRTKEDVLLEIKSDLEEKFKTYCDIESRCGKKKQRHSNSILYRCVSN